MCGLCTKHYIQYLQCMKYIVCVTFKVHSPIYTSQKYEIWYLWTNRCNFVVLSLIYLNHRLYFTGDCVPALTTQINRFTPCCTGVINFQYTFSILSKRTSHTITGTHCSQNFFGTLFRVRCRYSMPETNGILFFTA